MIVMQQGASSKRGQRNVGMSAAAQEGFDEWCKSHRLTAPEAFKAGIAALLALPPSERLRLAYRVDEWFNAEFEKYKPPPPPERASPNQNDCNGNGAGGPRKSA